jgi:hypothetical protein
MCGALADGSTITRADLTYVAEHVRKRVQAGVGLAQVTHAYRAGVTSFWSSCIAEAVNQGMSRDACLEVAKVAFDMADMLTTHAAEIFVREEARLRTHSKDAARDLLEVLLSGDVDAISADRHVAAPGLDPHETLVTAVATVTGGQSALDTAAATVGDCFADRRARPLLATRQNELVIIAPTDASADMVAALTASRERLATTHDVALFAGVSLPGGGFAAVRESYRHAVLALSHASGSRSVVALADLPAIQCALLTSTPTTRAIIISKGEGMTGLADVAFENLHATLTTFAACDMNLAKTAQHAVVELAIRDLKDQALAHFPSGRFYANAAWTVIAALAHNLLRWTHLLGRRRKG